MDIDPMELLQAEGVEFDTHERAHPNQRMTTVELAQLLAIDVEESGKKTGPGGTDRTEKFYALLDELQPEPVVKGSTLPRGSALRAGTSAAA